MSVAANQHRTFLRLLAALRPHWHRDAALPARIQTLLAAQRAFGSRDRRLYRELVYTALRYLPWIEPLLDAQPDEAVRRIAHLAADTPATRAFRAAFAIGEPPGGDKAELLPAWFRPHGPELFAEPELSAQLRRAPLWLRLQTADPAPVFAEFAARGWARRVSDLLPSAVELLAEADLTKTESWQAGRIEIQDLGSQLLLESIGVEPGARWLDACAGAGGKTLQLARLLGPRGHIDAHDIRPAALAELETRAARARQSLRGVQDNSLAAIRVVTRLETSLRDGAGGAGYDGVLVDAPCSGSGTWRRAPHLKWTTTEAQIDRAAATQRALLRQFSAHVRPGGRLVYATCSLSVRENEEVVAAFLAAEPAFRPEPFARTFGFAARGHGLTFRPAAHDTDGFFVASLRRA